MTAMPQMIALFNSFGGGAAALVGISEYRIATRAERLAGQRWPSLALFEVISARSRFTGRMIAFGKLQELITGQPAHYRGQKLVNFAAVRRGRSACRLPRRTCRSQSDGVLRAAWCSRCCSA